MKSCLYVLYRSNILCTQLLMYCNSSFCFVFNLTCMVLCPWLWLCIILKTMHLFFKFSFCATRSSGCYNKVIVVSLQYA
ncbi:hypothetical protein XENTR_v10011593 [Xenopus tropicalis]|nr:hypothetical protein XENTR_v10011593 [Xenopus tropicalis]